MAFVHGKDTEVWVDGADLSGYFHSAEFTVDIETADTTTFRQDWRTAVGGTPMATYEFEGYYDPTLADIKNLLPSTAAVVTVGPGGMSTVDSFARMMSSATTNYTESAPVGGVVGFTWSVTSRSPVGVGTVLHPLTAETADGNGTTVDNGAQSTAGAIAHLHVSSVSASDSIVVTVQDASIPSGGSSNWATIGTFASKSAAGTERITIAGTVRRYVRAVWDVTGTDVSITFGVTLART